MITMAFPPQGEPMDGPKWARWFIQFVSAFNAMTATGSTAQRPSPAPFVGFMFFDTTLGKPVWAKTLTQYVLADGTNA
ncbi:MAG: hypothetical protein MRJ68_20535 [Nitrospira sp.]|nr:hypothetical protein [Nitrospira sp.]